MIRSNVHTHCTWCDGANTAVEMAAAAYQLGFTDLGFSSHAPAVFDPGCPGLQDEAAYRADIARHKQEYAGKMHILCGVEQDSFAMVDRADYDYIIHSTHYFPPVDNVYNVADGDRDELRQVLATRFGGDESAFVRCYYEASVAGVQRARPDIVGHFDLITKYNRDNAVFDEESSAYRHIALEAMEAVLQVTLPYGGMVEVNTGAVARGYRDLPYPAPFILRYLAEKHGRVIITSDSHSVGTLNTGFDLALEVVRAAGFGSVAVLRDGAFTDIKI